MVDTTRADVGGQTMIYIVATCICKLGTETDFERAALDWFIPQSLEEPGCEEFLLMRQSDDPSKFVSHEIFRDQAALDEHVASPHVAKFFAFLTENEVQNEFHVYDALPSAGRTLP